MYDDSSEGHTDTDEEKVKVNNNNNNKRAKITFTNRPIRLIYHLRAKKTEYF